MNSVGRGIATAGTGRQTDLARKAAQENDRRGKDLAARGAQQQAQREQRRCEQESEGEGRSGRVRVHGVET